MATTNPILAQARQQVSTEQAATATPDIAASSNDINSALVLAPSGVSMSESLLAVQEAAGQAVTRSVNAIIDLEIGAKQSKVASDVMLSAISDATAANQIVQRTKDTANLQAQNATIDAFEVGGGTDGQVALMSQLKADNDRVTSILEERSILANEDRFGEGVGLLDNIINKFNTNLTNQQLKAATNKLQHTQNQIANVTGATEAFAKVNALTKKTLNEATIEANYNLIGADGQIKAAQAKISNVSTNATAMLNLMNADSRVTTNLLQSYKLEGEAEDRILKVERQKFLTEQMTNEREQWKLTRPKAEADLASSLLRLEQAQKLGPTQIAQAEINLAKTQKQQKDLINLEDSLVDSVQRGQSLAGATIEDRQTILWGLNQTGDTGKKYDRLQEIGGQPDAVLGLTPSEAKASVDTIAPTGNIKPNKGTKLLAQISDLQAAKYAQPTATAPRDKASQDADFNQTAKELVATFSANIAEGDASNPYAAPPFSVIEGSWIQQSPLYNKVLKPMKLKETNAQTILDASIAGVLAKVITPEEAAAGIEAIFDMAALINNTQDGGFRRVGLPNQTTFNTKINRQPTFFEQLKLLSTTVKADVVGGILGGTRLAISPESVLTKTAVTIDLMDKTKVQQLIIESLSSTPAAAPKPQ